MAIRTLVDPADPKDLERVHALQDAIKVEQASARRSSRCPTGTGQPEEGARGAPGAGHRRFPIPSSMFGPREQVDPVRHLIGSAMAWGGNPEKDAIYLNVTPSQNDGKTVYRLTVKDVPVDGFWSISVYNANGYFQPNKESAYTLNNITAKEGARTARSPSSSAAMTARLPTACRSCRAGTTSSVSIVRVPKY